MQKMVLVLHFTTYKYQQPTFVISFRQPITSKRREANNRRIMFKEPLTSTSSVNTDIDAISSTERRKAKREKVVSYFCLLAGEGWWLSKASRQGYNQHGVLLDYLFT
jgi:hypothetical protein